MRRRSRANRRKRAPLRRRLPTPRVLAREVMRGVWRRRAAMLSLAVAAVLAVASYGAGRYLSTSERFAISGIDLRGNARVEPAELADALSGFAGTNIFRARLARIEAKVAEHPWVESARVSRALPRGLRVDLVERAPAGLAYLGGMYLIDDAGVPFVRVRPGDELAEGLVVITGIDRQLYLRDPERAQASFLRALEAADRYAAAERPRLGEVHIGPRGELTLSTYDEAVAIRAEMREDEPVEAYLAGFDAAWEALSERERATARLFRIQGSAGPERVTVDFTGLIAGN